MYKFLPFALLVVLFLTDCTRKGISQRTASETQDTLTTFRPTYTYQKQTFTGETTIIYPVMVDSLLTFHFDVTRKLDSLLDLRYEAVVIKKEMTGYRVQIYYGSDREEARRIREKSYTMFSDYTPYLEYKVPTYRVKVGDFEYREDAMAIYRQMKRKFPQAIIVPDKVFVIKEATADDLIELRLKELEEQKKKKQNP